MDITWQNIKLRIGWTTKTDAYVFLSYFLLLALFASIVYDIAFLLGEESPQETTQEYTLALLVRNAPAA